MFTVEEVIDALMQLLDDHKLDAYQTEMLIAILKVYYLDICNLISTTNTNGKNGESLN